MEILLAALIVGVIGIALAALTTAAVREGGVGRTKVMLRQQLSLALRQLRQDIEQSSSIDFEASPGVGMTLWQRYSLGPHHTAPRQIEYRFRPDHHQIGAGGGYIGGVIERKVNGGTTEVWLSNVKEISREGFSSPSFESYGASHNAVRVRIIVEVPTEPVVNDVIDEVFMLPQGYDVENLFH